MTHPNERRYAITLIQSLIDGGWSVIGGSDGCTRYRARDRSPAELLDLVDGTETACIHFQRGDDSCTLSLVWGLGEDLLADYSANTVAVLDEITALIPEPQADLHVSIS